MKRNMLCCVVGMMFFAISLFASQQNGSMPKGLQNVGIKTCGQIFYISQKSPKIPDDWKKKGMDYTKVYKNVECVVRVPSGEDKVVQIILFKRVNKISPITTKTKIGQFIEGRIESGNVIKKYDSDEWQSFKDMEKKISRERKLLRARYLEVIGENVIHVSKKICTETDCFIIDIFKEKEPYLYDLYNKKFVEQLKSK